MHKATVNRDKKLSKKIDTGTYHCTSIEQHRKVEKEKIKWEVNGK